MRTLILACSYATAAAFTNLVNSHVRGSQPVRQHVPMMMMAESGAAAGAAPLVLLADGTPDAFAQLEAFQQSHAFLLSVMLAIATRLLISEIRRQVEKPVMDKIGEQAKEQLTPDTEQVGAVAWAQLAGCVALDLAGDASELIPFLGEFTDVAFAPVEAGLLFALFKSPLVSGLGFVEEILPFTDVVPTFCIGWCLQNLWPTTPAAQKLGIQPKTKPQA
jgi:hypothetical protein